MNYNPTYHQLISAVGRLHAGGNPEEIRAAEELLVMGISELEALRAENDRLRQDRLDYSSATTSEGLNASEWIWRTGKAERERDALRAERDALAARVEALLDHAVERLPGCMPVLLCRLCGAASQGGSHFKDCPTLSTPAADLAAHDRAVLEAAGNEHLIQVDELAALVRRLAHSLRKHSPDNNTALMAMDYLERNGLQGAPLRAATAAVSSGIAAIAAERRRQIEVEGWTPEHDDEHTYGEMADAAASYAWEAAHPGASLNNPPTSFPWGAVWWKPKDCRSNLVKAGALIAAEIDRLDRASAILGPDAGKGE
jgi:hypothetical protein